MRARVITQMPTHCSCCYKRCPIHRHRSFMQFNIDMTFIFLILIIIGMSGFHIIVILMYIESFVRKSAMFVLCGLAKLMCFYPWLWRDCWKDYEFIIIILYKPDAMFTWTTSAKAKHILEIADVDFYFLNCHFPGNFLYMLVFR